MSRPVLDPPTEPVLLTPSGPGPQEPPSPPRRLTAGAGMLLVTVLAAVGALGLARSPSGDRPADEPIGGAAPPPLPLVRPAAGYDPRTAIASHDGSVVAEVDGEVLTTVDGRTGEVSIEIPVGDDRELRALSADGSLSALFRRVGDRSEITVVDTGDPQASRRYELDGLVEPEAFSTDGELLFVIDHQISAEPGAYRVRPLDLATGRLETIVGPSKVPLEEDMNGRGRRQVWAADGQRLYTLYIRQTHHHHAEADGVEPHGHGGPGTDGFVHVLDLAEEWAHCLDLPPAFGGGDLDRTALAVSATSDELAVIDLDAGAVAFADTDALRVTGTAAIPRDLDPVGRIHLAMFDHHLAVGWGSTVRWLARPDLRPVGRDDVDHELFGFTSFGPSLQAWSPSPDRGATELVPPPAG